MSWLNDLFKIFTPKVELRVVYIKKNFNPPKDHLEIVKQMTAVSKEDNRNMKLIPTAVWTGQESNFWNKKVWDKPELGPHSNWVWRWIEVKPDRNGNPFIQDDVAAYMDIWNKDGGHSIEFCRNDGNNKDPVEFKYKKKTIANLYDKYMAVYI